mmetsp:Transcript_72410/g.235203  ORF Transcript_72410/g.235203 Transcript_72410/m.235203 type:complete len:284 (-) Transcript_72410:2413-3264(-)
MGRRLQVARAMHPPAPAGEPWPTATSVPPSADLATSPSMRKLGAAPCLGKPSRRLSPQRPHRQRYPIGQRSTSKGAPARPTWPVPSETRPPVSSGPRPSRPASGIVPSGAWRPALGQTLVWPSSSRTASAWSPMPSVVFAAPAPFSCVEAAAIASSAIVGAKVARPGAWTFLRIGRIPRGTAARCTVKEDGVRVSGASARTGTRAGEPSTTTQLGGIRPPRLAVAAVAELPPATLAPARVRSGSWLCPSTATPNGGATILVLGKIASPSLMAAMPRQTSIAPT